MHWGCVRENARGRLKLTGEKELDPTKVTILDTVSSKDKAKVRKSIFASTFNPDRPKVHAKLKPGGKAFQAVVEARAASKVASREGRKAWKKEQRVLKGKGGMDAVESKPDTLSISISFIERLFYTGVKRAKANLLAMKAIKKRPADQGDEDGPEEPPQKHLKTGPTSQPGRDKDNDCPKLPAASTSGRKRKTPDNDDDENDLIETQRSPERRKKRKGVENSEDEEGEEDDGGKGTLDDFFEESAAATNGQRQRQREGDEEDGEGDKDEDEEGNKEDDKRQQEEEEEGEKEKERGGGDEDEEEEQVADKDETHGRKKADAAGEAVELGGKQGKEKGSARVSQDKEKIGPPRQAKTPENQSHPPRAPYYRDSATPSPRFPSSPGL